MKLGSLEEVEVEVEVRNCDPSAERGFKWVEVEVEVGGCVY